MERAIARRELKGWWLTRLVEKMLKAKRCPAEMFQTETFQWCNHGWGFRRRRTRNPG